ncbi:MAG TPA: hypothetical protein VGJ91_18660, partial [Polyangiaceae bacterium]
MPGDFTATAQTGAGDAIRALASDPPDPPALQSRRDAIVPHWLRCGVFAISGSMSAKAIYFDLVHRGTQTTESYALANSGPA